MKFDVIGMGLVALDHIFLEEENADKPIYIGSIGGGSVGNTLSFLCALGFNTAIIGALGNDVQSDIIKQDLRDFGVNTNFLIQKKGTPGNIKRSRQYFQLISETNHSHSFVKNCPSCGSPINRNVIFTKNDLTDEMIGSVKKSKILHIDRANDTSISLARTILHNGGLVSFDFSFNSFVETRSKVNELISIATIIKANSPAFDNFLQRNKLSYDDFCNQYDNIRLLIITEGEKGLYGFIRGLNTGVKQFKYPAVKCNRLYDASGAGDILIGVVLAQLLKGSAKLEIGYEESLLNISQGIASINCCFYGARSYSRVLANNKTPAEEIFSIGENASRNGSVSCSLPPSSGISNSLKYPFRFETYDTCAVCGEVINQRKLTKRKEITNKFGKRLWEAHIPMIEAYSNANTKFINSKFIPKIKSDPILFVGSGGSYSSAVFGEQIVISLKGNPAMAMPPYELRTLQAYVKGIIPVLISYKGKNTDILYAFDRLRALKVENGIVITAKPDSLLAKRASDCGWEIYTIPEISGSIGHLATIGYLATLSTLAAIFAPDNLKGDLDKFFDFNTLYSISKSADVKAKTYCDRLELKPKEYHFIGLGSGWARPALIDLESKMVEGGISTIECSELKNFTHGRYISAYRHHSNRVAVILKCPPYNDLADFLKNRLKKQMHVFELSTEKEGIPGAIELVMQSLYLAHYLGLKEEIDIANPRYPPESKGMYSWVPKDSTQSEFRILY